MECIRNTGRFSYASDVIWQKHVQLTHLLDFDYWPPYRDGGFVGVGL